MGKKFKPVWGTAQSKTYQLKALKEIFLTDMDDTGNWPKKKKPQNKTLTILLSADKQWLSYWLQFAAREKIPLSNKHMQYPNQGRK